MTRHAAAILLTRSAGPDREVYLVERSKELRFFGGYWALPGGVLGAEDGAADDPASLRRCAVRELFEETGVLLDPALSATPASERLRVRRAMLGDDHDAGVRAWQELCGPHRGERAVTDVCRIVTPPFAPTRYDTLFVRAELPAGESPEVWPGELVAGRFVRPAAALDAWRRGELMLVPPVVILFEHLVRARDLQEFDAVMAATAAGYEAGRLHHVRFSPGVLLASLRSPTLPPATTTNCYIVGESELWIVDPAPPDADEQERLFVLLDELRGAGARLAGILVTHHHGDHVGAVAATSARYGLPVRGHPLTLERLRGDFTRGAPLHDGDVIPLGRAPDGTPGWHLQALFTPGHDRGHLCFRESRYDAVLVGDMLSTISTIVIDPPEGHLRTYLASLTRLLDVPMGTLYPAHGPAVRDGHRLVRQYLRHRAQREQKLISVLAAGPADAATLLPQVYWDVDPRMFGVAARSLAAGLEKLAEDGVARVDAAGIWHLLPGRASSTADPGVAR
ncbi:MAG TPA: MBL fold metallo-hydrolase [Planctomycetota bacterium]|nr:MBL fold metallo-hydrolase [Planctomycetota bacterium]